MSDRITIHDYVQSEFYQLPKEFFDKSSKYFDLSMNAKVLYSLLKSRLELSKKNNWVNENGEVYLIMTRLEAADLLGVGETVARRTFHELENAGLIDDVRQGLTKPNVIYINKFVTDYSPIPSENNTPDRQNLTASYNDNNYNEKREKNCNNCLPDARDLINNNNILNNINPNYLNLNDYSLVEKLIERYAGNYLYFLGKAHPVLKREQAERVVDKLDGLIGEFGLSEEDVCTMADYYFEHQPKQGDMNINLFATEGIFIRVGYSCGTICGYTDLI